ncbi:histidine--tRNA ligase [Brevundimonas sp. 2R-24]|uniref:Histidine--tRNA ligase n=1 Tax=Peiella sedimenti TaxID=3061083 RepID=A0ABT8SL01_9CAUL|nr:histidine--tRNA ligase [Caulobacteraceae bacterium XZ-24]
MTSPADDTFAPRPEPRAPRGFPDRRGADLAGERRLIAALAGVYERYGFEPLDTPAFEYADALGKFLPDADRPNEGVFALRDDDEQWMALRYDLTAPLARFAAENWQTLAKPYRRWAYGSVWRNEKPGPGRFRQFTQCDADTVGSDRPEADAEMVALAVEGLAAAGVPAGAAVMKISTRKLLDGLMEAHGIVDQAQRLTTLRAIDKFDRLGWAGVRDLLGKGRLDESGDFTRGAGLAQGAVNDIEVFLNAAAQGLSRQAVLKALADGKASATRDQGLSDLERIDQALTAMGVTDAQARFDPAVVRGLEYYTGAVFEAELVATDAKGQPLRLGSVGGGGRYDDLVARFTGERTPATGFSFGVSRLTVALQAMEWAGAGKAPRGPVVVLALDAEGMADFFAAAAELRAAGIAAEVYLGGSGMKAQMKYADRRLAPAVVILGGDERASGQVTIKDLDLGRALAAGVSDHDTWKSERPGQQTVPRVHLVEVVNGIVDA